MLHAPPSDREPLRRPAASAAQPASGTPLGERAGGEREGGDKVASGARVGGEGRTLTSPGGVSQALAGRRIGLICESSQAPAAALFIEAAEGLGAQVSVLHAADVVDARAGQQDKLVRMLSRLYDVIECQDLPTAAVRHIAELVAVPVLANLGARALESDGPLRPEPGTPAWEQGLAQVRQALLMAL